MFGYVRAAREEMRIKEYEYYRASYCGLCLSMGKCTGQCSRMLLSYDFAYLANVRMALAGTEPSFHPRRCIAHPFRKRMMMDRNEQLDFCAVASTILAYEKCRDNVADERGFARFRARLSSLFLKGAYRRAKKRAPVLAEKVHAHLARLSALEKERTPSVDTVAAVFGDLLADVTAYGFEGSTAAIARKIGFETGRVIYILDALDDFSEDVKKGRYNPLVLVYGEEMTQTDKEGIKDALLLYLSEIESAFDLMDSGKDPIRQEILNNILYLGIPQTVDRVLSGKKCQKEDHNE